MWSDSTAAMKAIKAAVRTLASQGRRRGDPRLVVFLLMVFAMVVSYTVARGIFPYHSLNHDEGVYLQQAALLLEGQLYLHPPVREAFRPWFFVADGGRLYPKYAPVTAAIFALGKMAGGYRLALPFIAAVIVALTYALVAEAFDQRTALVAIGLLLASPLFIVHSGLFLPYAPTTAWNLLFAFGYLRADRTGSRWWAAIAGGAIGVAFFARPYTAVLFATPFIGHALWTLRGLERAVLIRHLSTAALGLIGVLVALGYNALVTGEPLVFPYEVFAPGDRIGFGHRSLGAYEVAYTPSLALRANARILGRLFGQWVVAGPLGTALAAIGLTVFFGRIRDQIRAGTSDMDTETAPGRHYSSSDLARQGVIAGLFLTIVAGNVYFWGNLNLLGDLADPNDGLIEAVGPVYHYDLIVPTAAFAAVGGRTIVGYTRARLAPHVSPAVARPVVVALALVAATVFGVMAGGTVSEPLAENRAVSDRLAEAYDPVDVRDLNGSLVFLPTPYGNWLNHPFQALRNDPGFDGETVWAIRENQFAVVDAFPNRRYYRYTYRGEWLPLRDPAVDARLQRVHVVRGNRVVVDTRVGVPAGFEGATFVLSAGDRTAYYAADGTGNVSIRMVVENGRARLIGDRIEWRGTPTVPIGDSESLQVQTLVHHPSGGFEYWVTVPITRESGQIRAITPYLETCRNPRLCGGEQAYVPRVAADGVFISADVRSTS